MFLKNVLKSKKTAYSLLELSIVIAISAILVSAGLAIATGYSNKAKVELTKDRMDVIYEALGNFLVIHNRLPCPASILEIKSTSTVYGESIGSAGSCSGTGTYISGELVYGMVPIRDLGLETDLAQDAFKDKIAYIVDRRFTKATVVPDGGVDSFGTAPSTSLMTVNEVSSTATQVNTTDAIFVLVSYGSNQSGSFGVNMSTQRTRSNDANEMENDLNGSSFNATIIAEDTASDIFDDIVLYKTRNDIALDFQAFSAIPCPLSVNEIQYGGTFHSWAQSNYGQISPSTDACESGFDVRAKYPTRKCEAFGIWETNATTPCSDS